METLFRKRKEQLENFKKAIRRFVPERIKREIPDNIFKKCEKCGRSVSVRRLKENNHVCPDCGRCFKVSAAERIEMVFDAGSFYETDRRMTSTNSENFEGYSEKLAKYKKRTGLNEAVVCGTAKIDGRKCAVAVMDSNFMMGSMGAVVGEKICRTIELAHGKKLPLIIFCTSGGARMQEGIISLMQMAKTSAALKRFSDSGNLYISVLTHPTTGGVSASFAMLGDIIIAEPGALIGFAGKRVIEKTINESLPEEFQRAEFVMEKGFVDMIADRDSLRKTLSDLIAMHTEDAG